MNLTDRPILRKEPRWECKKLRDSARDRPCTGQSDWCNGDPNTTVWAHSNFSEHGKGVGMKAHDIFGAFLCSGCHLWFDTASKQEGFSNEECVVER